MLNNHNVTLSDISAIVPKNTDSKAWFEPRNYLGKRGFKYFSKSTQYLLSAYTQLNCAEGQHLNPDTTGVVVGANYGMSDTLHNMLQTIRTEGANFLSPQAAPNFCINMIASQLSIKHKFHRFNLTLTTPKTAGLDALITGVREIRAQRAFDVLCGAAEERQPGAEINEGATLFHLRQANAKDICSIHDIASFFVPNWEMSGEILAQFHQHVQTQLLDLNQAKKSSAKRLIGIFDSEATESIVGPIIKDLSIPATAKYVTLAEREHGTLDPLMVMKRTLDNSHENLFVYASREGQLRIIETRNLTQSN